MTSESSEQDEQNIALHRELDRLLDCWDDLPTYEKWRQGGKWR